MDYNYNNKELLLKLEELKDSNVEEFTNLMLAAFRVAPNQMIIDPHPSEQKLRALNAILKYLETTERFEDCAFIKTIIDKINEQ